MAYLSFFFTLAFAIYNLIISILYNVSWNFTIFIYYFVLLLLRLYLLICLRRFKAEDSEKVKTIYIISFIFILLLNVSLIGPTILLINNNKAIHADRFTSIINATFVFVCLISSIINYQREAKSNNLIRQQLRLTNFIKSIVSLMVLANTLINVYGSPVDNTYLLLLFSTVALVLLILFVSIFSFVKNINSMNLKKNIPC